jgi:hypothetical protein
MSNFNFKERHEVKDQLNIIGQGIPKRTRIIAKDHDTGEVIGIYENKILVPGSQMTAAKLFGIEQKVIFPTYNTELGLENSLEPYPETQPLNPPIVCLWAAGRSGAGSADNEVNVVSTTDRISPALEKETTNLYTDIVPFRYVKPTDDLDDDERDYYYGRKIFEEGTSSERIGYFFKAFDTEPQLHVRYLDGTEVTNTMYNVVSSQQVEVYVEMRLSVTKEDFRDYFDDVLGWDDANISTISLLLAWYDDTRGDTYRWYQDIIPYSKFNFAQEKLIDLNRAIDFNYQVYF